jgi:hypothetical protein
MSEFGQPDSRSTIQRMIHLHLISDFTMAAKNVIFIGILHFFFPFLLRGQQTNLHVEKTKINNVNTLSGKVFFDQNQDEQFGNEPVLKHWFVKAVNTETGQTHWTATTETGHYAFKLDIGTYKIQVITPNRYWLPFQQDTYTTFNALDSEALLDFGMKSATLSPAMQVDIVATNFQSCTDNTYTVRYANNGTSVANDAYIHVNLDESLEFVGASQPLFAQTGSTLRFNVGSIPVNGFGSFTIKAKGTCRETNVSVQNLCTNAHVFPNTVSSVAVSGTTQSWSVVQNGANAHRYSKNSIITEDVIIFMMPVNPDFPSGGGLDSINVKKTDINSPNGDTKPLNDLLALRAYQTAYFSGHPESVATPFSHSLCHPMQVIPQWNVVLKNKQLNESVRVYPNPILETATFEIVENVQHTAQLLVFDGLGKLVHQEKFAGNQLVLHRQNLVNGLYFYKIMNGNAPLSIGKFVVGKK